MSTKIHQGYKIGPSDMTLGQCLERLKPWRSALSAVATEELDRATIGLAVQLLDRRLTRLRGVAVGLHPAEENARISSGCLGQARAHLAAEIEEDRRLNRFNGLDPYSCLSLFVDDSGTYAILFAEQRLQRKVFAQLPEVEEYAYWNNTDPPPDMDPEIWEARSERWRTLLRQTPLHVDLVPKEALHLQARRQSQKDFSFPEDWQGSHSDRVFHVASATPAAHSKRVAAEFDRTRRLSVYMQHHERLRAGKVRKFNAQCAALKWLPMRYALDELKLTPEELEERWRVPSPPSREP